MKKKKMVNVYTQMNRIECDVDRILCTYGRAKLRPQSNEDASDDMQERAFVYFNYR